MATILIAQQLMSTPNQSPLTVEDAQKLLEDFTCVEQKSLDSSEEKAAVRDALKRVSSLSDYQIFGVCAASASEGFLALQTYLMALGYHTALDKTATTVEGPIYIKFNGLRGSYYTDSYTGPYRGILVSCQSAGENGINATYGHLPLDLFLD